MIGKIKKKTYHHTKKRISSPPPPSTTNLKGKHYNKHLEYDLMNEMVLSYTGALYTSICYN